MGHQWVQVVRHIRLQAPLFVDWVSWRDLGQSPNGSYQRSAGPEAHRLKGVCPSGRRALGRGGGYQTQAWDYGASRLCCSPAERGVPRFLACFHSPGRFGHSFQKRLPGTTESGFGCPSCTWPLSAQHWRVARPRGCRVEGDTLLPAQFLCFISCPARPGSICSQREGGIELLPAQGWLLGVLLSVASWKLCNN